MYEDTPEDLVAERLSAVVYKGTALARPILGTQATLSNMTGESLKNWQKTHYRAGNMVAALAGSYTGAQVDQIISLLDTLEPGTIEQTPGKYTAAVTSRRKNMEQNHLILAFPAMNYLDPRRYQLLMLNSLLGGGCSSRLFQQVREQRGLCYSVYSYVADHEDVGLQGIYTAVNPEQEGETLAIIRSILEDLAEHGPSQEELDRVREQATAGLLLGSESIQSRMSHLGNAALLYHKVKTVDEIIEEYNAVTREQLRKLAGEMFNWNNASLSAVGKVKTIADYSKWLGR
jgi:predicted Zn-dependent peptidase